MPRRALLFNEFWRNGLCFFIAILVCAATNVVKLIAKCKGVVTVRNKPLYPNIFGFPKIIYNIAENFCIVSCAAATFIFYNVAVKPYRHTRTVNFRKSRF